MNKDITELRNELKELRPLVHTPRIITVIESMLEVIERQQQEINALQKVSHYHRPFEDK